MNTKKYLLILIVLLFMSCGESLWIYRHHGKVRKATYIPSGWGQNRETILYFDNVVIMLYGHREVPMNKTIYLYREKDYFIGHETIFEFKLKDKKGKYYIYNK